MVPALEKDWCFEDGNTIMGVRKQKWQKIQNCLMVGGE